MIEFTLYGPSATANCSGPPVYTGTGGQVLAGGSDLGGMYATQSPALSQPGTYWWTASYSGNASNWQASSACGDPGSSVVIPAIAPGKLYYTAPPPPKCPQGQPGRHQPARHRHGPGQPVRGGGGQQPPVLGRPPPRHDHAGQPGRQQPAAHRHRPERPMRGGGGRQPPVLDRRQWLARSCRPTWTAATRSPRHRPERPDRGGAGQQPPVLDRRRGTIMQANLDGSNPQHHPRPRPGGVAVDSSRLYWADASRVPNDHGRPTWTAATRRPSPAQHRP